MNLKSILYIEDNAAEAENIRLLYQSVQKKFEDSADFEVAKSWEDGVKMVELIKPDVVIVDLSLPPTSGTAETIEHIREVSGAWPPILVLTGNFYDLTLRRRCILAGASDFTVKEAATHGATERLVERIYNCHLRRLYRDGSRS